MMMEYDRLIKRLQDAIKENIVCEDNELYVKCKLKYDVVNIMNEEDSVFMKKLYEELEYNEE